jgi:hypothetical protein
VRRRRRAGAPPRPWRLVVGSHLIALGCRVWLSGRPDHLGAYATSSDAAGSQPVRSPSRASLENTSTIG